jgi:hypothetical protein
VSPVKLWLLDATTILDLQNKLKGRQKTLLRCWDSHLSMMKGEDKVVYGLFGS